MNSELATDGVMRRIREDDSILEALGSAMYEIRAPQKSKRVSYDSLSLAQKQANRQAAIAVITATANSRVSTPDEMVDGLARHFYSQLAPQKSQVQPWHSRSEFHHSWYRTQATNFLTALMNGLPSDHAIGSSRQASELPTARGSESVLQQALHAKSTVSIDSVQSLAVGSKELKALQTISGESLSDLGDETLGAQRQQSTGVDDSMAGSKPQASSTSTQELNHVASMLGLIAILLLILIIVVIIF